MAADLTPVYYIAATAASIGAVLGGARSYYARQRARWTDEGARATRQADVTEANTKAAKENTVAIKELTTFVDETRHTLLSHDGRIGRLEDIVRPENMPRHLRGDPADN